jgi:hypothetical protein
MERERATARFWFWRKLAWATYLVGLPPVVAIFAVEQNWLFAAIEVGGAPAMMCGLVAAFSRKDPPAWLDQLALIAIPIGIIASLWNLGLSKPLAQGLEVAGSIGFLVGTYLLAKDREEGYRWFLVMNLATGILLGMQGYYLFVPQQILSIILIADAHRVRKRKNKQALSG